MAYFAFQFRCSQTRKFKNKFWRYSGGAVWWASTVLSPPPPKQCVSFHLFWTHRDTHTTSSSLRAHALLIMSGRPPPQPPPSGPSNLASSVPKSARTLLPPIPHEPEWGSRSVDIFQKLEQIGEGTYGYVLATFQPRNLPWSSSNWWALRSVNLNNDAFSFFSPSIIKALPHTFSL